MKNTVRNTPGRGLVVNIAAIAGIAALAGCGSDNNDSNNSGQQNVVVAQSTLVCDDSLKAGFKPDANTKVLMVKAFKKGDPLLLSGAATATTPIAENDLCMVKLNVGPGNPGPANAPSTSPGIGIEVWLPTPANWNNRIHVKGGGGWAGGDQGSLTALDGAEGPTSPAATAGIEGAVSASTDTGHANTANSGSFAMNPDGTINTALWKDFSERGIHEMAVKTKALTKAYYGKEAKYAYFNGFSTGGRQALKEAQAFPGDFDGILAGAPGVHWTRFTTSHLQPQVVMHVDLGDVRLTVGQQRLVSNAAVNACDVVGGQHLGYVPDPTQCRYDPTTDVSVLCVANGGINTTTDCVTPVQANAFNKIWYGQTDDGSVPSPAADNGLNTTLATSQRFYGPTRGSDLSGFIPRTSAISSAQVALELQDPSYATPEFINATGNGTDRWKTLTYAQLSNAQDRGLALQAAFSNINTDNPDLSAFRDRGGKLVMYHGLADPLMKVGGSINYYHQVANKMGGINAIQSFYRFYAVPGMHHGLFNGSANPNANPPLPTDAQLYALLTDWVEKNTAPSHFNITTTVTTANPVQKSRPLCVYPQKATYVSGDVNLSSSYTCS